MPIEPVETSPAPPPSIWEELETWSKGFAPWQRLLLASAIRSGVISETTMQQAYALFLTEYALAELPEPMPDIPKSVTGRQRDALGGARLHRVHSPSGVNRLPSAAELTFSNGLTIVYGGNGVGKSGFVRLLSNACFSRQQHPIYPDVFDENAPMTPSASIELVDDKGIITKLTFDNVVEHPPLKRGFVVFDSAVAIRHLTETSPLGFTPTGFDVFAEMARGYSELQAMLAADIQGRRRENTFANAFIGPSTAASTAASTLGRQTDLDALRALASFGIDEAARIEDLQTQADQLRANSPALEIARITEARPHIVVLKEQLALAHAALTEEVLGNDFRLSADLVEAAVEVARLGATQFSHGELMEVGSPYWTAMVEAAQRLSSVQHMHYPDEGDICLLCQQPLDAGARDLFARYATFVSGESRRRIEVAKAAVEWRQTLLKQLNLQFAADGSVAHSFLAGSYPAVLTSIAEHAARVTQLREAAVAALAGTRAHPSAIAMPDFGQTLGQVLAVIDSDLDRLRQGDVSAALKAVDDERTELRHREVLAKNLEQMVSYVRDLQWVEKANGEARAALNPRHLTEKEQELFATVIGGNYRAALAEECKALACGVPVKLRTQGKKGQTVRSLVVAERSPGDILSEGEQRAVALADFLTEVGLNEDNVGIILDDPVTSLDHDRKDRIAARLVEEAAKRQVIVFTHDLVFFAKLGDAADKLGLTPATHWMQRSADDKPGVVSLNDAPTTTPQYRNANFAEDTLARAKVTSGSAQETLVRQGAAQLRRTVEEIVPQYLFKEVVRRWTDRVMVTALKRINWDNSLADEIVEVFENCSAIMEGHSHTEAGTEARPTPAMLEALITRTKEIIRRVKLTRP